jgi:hypothetical protein
VSYHAGEVATLHYKAQFQRYLQLTDRAQRDLYLIIPRNMIIVASVFILSLEIILEPSNGSLDFGSEFL